MFRTVVLRAGRLSRASGVSSAVAVSLRPVVLRSAGMPQTAVLQRGVPTLSAVARFSRRGYSTATADAAYEHAEGKEAEQTAEVERDELANDITLFSELGKAGVHPAIVKGLTKGMGYEKMTTVQSKAMRPALDGKDIVAQAKTGTGKTLAFLVPILQRMIDNDPQLGFPIRRSNRIGSSSPIDIQAIIMSPTRELAEQIGEEARKLLLAADVGIVVQTAVGGTQKRMNLARMQRQGCHLLVATPGRLNDLLSSPYDGISVPNLKALVLDEADRMLDDGFSHELAQILAHLPDRRTNPRQTLLFSATVPKNVVSLARSYVDPKNFTFVQTVDPNEPLTHEKVPQQVLVVRDYENMYPTLLELIEREAQAAHDSNGAKMPFKAIVFLPTLNFVQLTEMVFRKLRYEHRRLPRVFTIHSKLSQNVRTAAADSFREASSGVLFSSDVTARGMHFPNVTHVIQVGLPPDRDQYIHRLGRTARAGKDGEGWVIVARHELDAARMMLTDLPIKRVQGFESADFDGEHTADDDSRPRPVVEVASAMQSMPQGLLEDTYLSSFSNHLPGVSMQARVSSLNSWATKGWGWKEPPAISAYIANKRGLARIPGVNVKHLPARVSRRKDEDNGGVDEFEREFSGSSGRYDSRPNRSSSGDSGRGGNSWERGGNRNSGGRGGNRNSGGRGGNRNSGGRGGSQKFTSGGNDGRRGTTF